MIPVTKPFLPPVEEYQELLKGIWGRGWLTNNGPLVQQLEAQLKEYLSVEHLLYTNNGTFALQIAIKALGLKGEIITTPFSYVATTGSIVWEGCTPVFVDIDAQTFNIDPTKIESAITPNTSAILATHCFGNACNIDAIETIATKYNLKVIYDAAHCFGTTYKGKNIFAYGDVSTTSFHATKLFHSIEGGAVFTPSAQVYDRMKYMRNFGHDGPEKYNGVGINGKNSEFHAAMGLCVFNYLSKILSMRYQQWEFYREALNRLPVQFLSIQEGCGFNYAYFPVVFKDERTLLAVKTALEENGITPRRYFYPSLNSIGITPYKSCPISEVVSSRVLCLPMYHNLLKEEQIRIIRIISDYVG
ncbi:MAG: DegT/DnrJ/EryC1/StrS family aminotransferase [Flavobacteriales bacterium]